MMISASNVFNSLNLWEPKRTPPHSLSISSHGHDQDLIPQDIIRSELNDASMLSTVLDGSGNLGIDAQFESHLGPPFSSSFAAHEAGNDQYIQSSNGSNDSWGVTSEAPGEAAASVPTVTTFFDGLQLDATSNFQTAHWNDNTTYSLYAPHLQPVLEQGSYTPSNVQHLHHTQSASFPSTRDNRVGSPQTASDQTHVDSDSTSGPYAEQYLLDIEQWGGNALSIHVRIPPSIPGAMYFGSHLMAEFSQEADGILNVRVHLPPGYANVNSTFVHA